MVLWMQRFLYTFGHADIDPPPHPPPTPTPAPLAKNLQTTVYHNFNLEHVLFYRFVGLLFYRNVPKFSDRQVWANSTEPDQTARALKKRHLVKF